MAIQGGTRAQQQLLRTIVARSRTGAIRSVRISSGSGRLSFLIDRTDRASSTEGKWIAMVVGRAFADASARRALPKIGRLTIRVADLPARERSRLVLQLPPAPPASGLSRQALTAIVRQSRARGIDARRVVAFRLAGKKPEAIQLNGRIRNPAATYLQVLSETAAAPASGAGAYYELADDSGRPAVRLGIVNGFARRDRLVAWVRPDLLKRP